MKKRIIFIWKIPLFQVFQIILKFNQSWNKILIQIDVWCELDVFQNEKKECIFRQNLKKNDQFCLIVNRPI